MPCRTEDVATLFGGERPRWESDGRDWPNREASRFVEAAGLRWHVQVMGDGPVVLLLHGTGGASHSWRAMAPLLAERQTVVAPDLPAHGFTAPPVPWRMTLPAMAEAVAGLLRALDLSPALVVGHSAGAAVAIRMALDGHVAPDRIVSLNGALLTLQGPAGHLFLPLARLVVLNPLVPRLVAWRARDRAAVERMIGRLGSTIEPEGVEFYRRLVNRPGHVAGALAMMANWNLAPLGRDLPRLAVPLRLVVGERDLAVPPGDADRVQALLPSAEIVRLPGLGHLAHEEAPAETVRLVLAPAPVDAA